MQLGGPRIPARTLREGVSPVGPAACAGGFLLLLQRAGEIGVLPSLTSALVGGLSVRFDRRGVASLVGVGGLRGTLGARYPRTATRVEGPLALSRVVLAVAALGRVLALGSSRAIGSSSRLVAASRSV